MIEDSGTWKITVAYNVHVFAWHWVGGGRRAWCLMYSRHLSCLFFVCECVLKENKQKFQQSCYI